MISVRRLFFWLAVAALILGGVLTWTFSNSIPTKVAPPGTLIDFDVRGGGQGELTLDRTKMRVDLYPVSVEHPKDRPNGEQYRTTGWPISFAFPRTAMGNSRNWRGGAQFSLPLMIDRLTMRPILDVAAEQWTPEERKKDRIGGPTVALIERFLPRYLEMEIWTQAYGLRDLGWNGVDIPSLFKETPSDDLGSRVVVPQKDACGFKLFLTEGFLDRAGKWTRTPDPSWPTYKVGDSVIGPGTIEGYLIANPNFYIVKCSFAAEFCVVTFRYEFLEVSYKIPQQMLCDHPNVTARIVRMLNAHRVSPSHPLKEPA